VPNKFLERPESMRTSAISLLAILLLSGSSWNNPMEPVALATPAVAKGRHPVLRVVHDKGPGEWQFYDDVEELTEPVVMPKEDLLRLDSTLLQITDLPDGWEAERKSKDAPWERRRLSGDGG
jgi:hypothetical protein